MIKRILFTFCSFTLLLLACGSSDPANTAGAGHTSRGEMIFNTHCTACHGGDGKLGINEASDLSRSALTRDEMIRVVTNGRRDMMPYRHVLPAADIEAVVDHVSTLKAGE